MPQQIAFRILRLLDLVIMEANNLDISLENESKEHSKFQ